MIFLNRWESEVVGATAEAMVDDAIQFASEFFDVEFTAADVFVTDVRPSHKIEIASVGSPPRILVDGYSGTVLLTETGQKKVRP